jgi:hypothetical protein
VIIGDPPIAKCVERFFKSHPDARRLIDAPPPGPTKVEAIRVGNAMVNQIGGLHGVGGRRAGAVER